MRRAIGFFLAGVMVLGPSIAAAQEASLFSAFDPAELRPQERRLVQTALASVGDYSGALDGAWDASSQHGLEAYAAREFSETPRNMHLATLILRFAEMITREGWVPVAGPGGLSVALPLAELSVREGADGAEWISEDGGLSIIVTRQDADAAAAWHLAVAGADVGAQTGARAIRVREPRRMVTSSQTADGLRIFQWSGEMDGGWNTLRVLSSPDRALDAGLIAASVGNGPLEPWSLPPDGLLARMVTEALATLLDRSASDQRPTEIATPGPEVAPSTGSGFFVGPDLMVTAAHVVADCADVTLVDGAPLRVVVLDRDLDLAVLRTTAPVAGWLRLGGAPGLGQRVNAVGYPYYGLSGTRLNVTGGNVSALAGMDDDARFLSISAPVQPGNSGGPLLDASGAVAGVVVARLSDDYIIEETGSLPQNVNYAVRTSELVRLMSAHGLRGDDNGLPPFDMDDGAPNGMLEAVRPLVCR